MSDNYTKLFSSITESTIWGEPAGTRLVWITFLAKCNKHGEVFGSVPGLARLSNVTLDECTKAIETLLTPDKWSRTPDNEGRRIEVIDGGWRILNHSKFDAIRGTVERAEYKRKWDKENRGNRPNSSNRTPDTPPTTPDMTPTVPTPPVSSQQSAVTKELKERAKARRASAPSLTLQDWLSTLGDVDAIPESDPIFTYAETVGIPVEYLKLSWDRFCETMIAGGKRQKDWRSHYRNSVKGNWGKVWDFSRSGECYLTTAGKQAQRVSA